MVDQRNDFIEKYYTNIKVSSEYLDIFAVRTAIFESIKENLSEFKGVTLDVGCGIMPYREFLLKNADIEKYLGLDFENTTHQDYVMATPDLFWEGKTIPLQNETVDTVIATELLEHCEKPEEVLLEINRVLKPGGTLFLTVPFLWNLHLVPYDAYRYTSFTLRRILEQTGFERIDIKALGGWDASLAQMLGIWYTHRPLQNKKLLGWLCSFFIKLLLKKDKFFNRADIYREGVMVPGFSGVSFKPI